MTGPELLIASAVISLAGGVATGINQIGQSRAQNRQLEAEAQAADMNAQIMKQNAALEQRRRQRELKESRRRFNLAKGESRAQAAALGMSGGSLSDILADLDDQAIFEQRSIVDERTSSQQGFNTQSATEKARAAGMRGAKRSGAAAAAGSIIGSIGSAAGTIAGVV